MRRYVQAACVATALAFTTLGRADDAATNEAQARFKEGLELADASKFDAARLKFLQAFAVLKAPSVLFNLAATEQKTGHDVEAVEHYREFVKSSANDAHITDAMREKAKRNIADLLKKVAQIDIDAPDGAKISVDGKPLDDARKEPIAVAAGRHRVEAALGGRIKSVTVESEIGQVAKAKIDLDDGERVADTTPPPETKPARTWSTGRIVTVSALAAGAVAGGVLSIVFHGNAQDKVDQAKGLLHGSGCVGSTSPACTTARHLKDDRDSAVTMSTVSLVGGGVLAAGAVATAAFWPTHAERSARVVPLAAPGYAGVGFVGGF